MSLQWIILASPPCEVYSRANTTGKVDEVSLKAADELVSCIFLFKEHLGAIATVVENPSTGRLPNRSVSTFNYCAYGAGIKKPTMLFASFQLELFGFQSLLCPGATCLSVEAGRHAPWEKIDKKCRQAIPEQVSIQVANSISKFIEKKGKPLASCIRQTAMKQL